MKVNQKITNCCKTIEELVSEYIEYASQHGKATEQGDYKKGNKAHDKLIKIYQQIKKQGDLTHPMFKEMLSSSDLGVRSWAASHSLAVSPKEAEAILIDIGKIPNSLVAFSATMTLEEWKKAVAPSAVRNGKMSQ
ncbi:MAG: DUF2019 domain-containing protein [Fibromonadaceae bacterium]|jgi:hypothetical protein|nr:DUF2019 domain-containing protein [Fibromonadaceae bacterium]